MAGLKRIISARAGDASYDIIIGSSVLPETLKRMEINAFESLAVIISTRVYELHREYIEEALAVLGNRRQLLLFNDREENKNYTHAGRFLEKFIEIKLNRKAAVIGIGGGVVGDFAGFCAGVYMRGIPVIHVPTTLLAMVDSSIGGKTAVNLMVGKNIVGLFRQPVLVASDVLFLKTLPDSELRNGVTEALKHGLIGDKPTLELLERCDLTSIRDEDRLAELVALSAAFKARIVEMDEREHDLRAILNFGHTVGHAIESAMEYRGIAHGQAVAAGIRVKAEISRRMGLLTDAAAARINRLVDAYGLMPEKTGLGADEIIAHMVYDKKNFGGVINFVLLEGLGKPSINRQIPVDLLREVVAEVLC